MTRPSLVTAAVATILTVAAPAARADGFYLRGDFAAAFSQRNSGDMITGTKFPGTLSTSFAPGLGAGMTFADMPVRLDVTAQYLSSLKVSSTQSTLLFPPNPNTAFTVQASAKTRQWLLLANAYYDFPVDWAARPFVGLSAGAAFNKLNTVGYVFTDGRGGQTRAQEAGKSKADFAWGATVGAAMKVAPNWNVDLSYRWLNAGKFETSGQLVPGGATNQTSARARLHIGTLSVRYAF